MNLSDASVKLVWAALTMSKLVKPWLLPVAVTLFLLGFVFEPVTR